ncbi:MAG: hypothetical protein M1838_006107 [Thelocarpon superellum]|nr:MAG: hypothetical protein M1838_006107 [Thelocarpon superellum]
MLSAPATPSSLPAPQPASSLSSSFAAKSSASSSSIQSRSQAAGVPQASPVSMRFAASSQVIAPGVARSNPLGSSSNQPTSQYIQIQAPPAPQIASDLLTVGVDGSLSTAAYGLAPDTGVLLVNDSTQALITDLSAKPHLSRDGGKGGYLNGQKLFVFCDTGSYTQPSQSSTGNFLGFVSSSVAIDVNMSAAQGLPLTLEDGIGEWSDNQGRMRGLSPLTSGEQGYNDVMQGQGQRYAVWPESSLIPYNQTSALMYAPIVYDNVNEVTRQAVFTYTGTTLLVITAHTEGGPSAERVVDKLFEENEVEWGTIGGLRSYGPSGVGGNDGKVYLFGTTTDGLLLARVAAGSVTDRNSYEYWTGFGWSPGMQANNSEAHFVSGAFTSGDIFYSPAHLTFIFVFLNPYADNTFYFQYLLADHALLPPSAPGGDPTSDIAENLVKYGWSEPQVLYKAPAGPTGMYIYAGGVHQGYFDEDDITNGGKRVLLSWTVPTGANPGAQSSEYSLMTADLTFA